MSSLVSVIMPVYNGENYVAQAIESVLTQSYPHFELLIVNDGSTDATEAIVKQYGDLRIRYFFQKNAGVSVARNLALANMKGEFFCCLDSDDVLPENSIQSRLLIFGQSPSISFVDGLVKVYDARLEKLLYQWKPRKQGYVFRDLIQLTGNCFFGPTWMVKRMPGVNYQFEIGMTHGEDLLFYISLAKYGEYAFTDDCILHYRKNEQSVMNNLSGLGKGYAILATRLAQVHGAYFNRWDRILFHSKIRKIMFLSFLNNQEYRKAIEYLILGQNRI